MIFSIGSDHCGYELKSKCLEAIRQAGHEVIDNGCHDTNPVDFPDIVKLVAERILNGEAERGILFCGTGVGASIASNKIKGIRATVCHDAYSAHQCVEHDDVQIICLGGQVIGEYAAFEIISAFARARFLPDEEFRRRVEKIKLLEED